MTTPPFGPPTDAPSSPAAPATDLDALALDALATPDPEGAELLCDVETFLGRFVAYPSEHARVAHVLWVAHCWFMDRWDSTPRIAFLSPEPGSGKSRALEVTEPLVPRPLHAVNVTPAFLFRSVADPEGRPTILYDEIDTVFGPKAKDNEDVRGMLNAGHRRGAFAGRVASKGNTLVPEKLEAYCAVALAGLDDLPDTVMTRSVVVRMRRRAPRAGLGLRYSTVEPWRARLNAPEGHALADRLASWAAARQEDLTWPTMPPGVVDRNADVWEALIAVADLAGTTWPQRARAASLALIAAAADRASTIGVQLLRDLRTVFGHHDALPTDTVLDRLTSLPESLWAELRGGKPLDARGLARRLEKYGVKPVQYRDAAGKHRGYRAADLADPWGRYLLPVTEDDQPPALGPGAQTPETPGVDQLPVAPPPGHCPTCWEDLTQPEGHLPDCPASGAEQ